MLSRVFQGFSVAISGKVISIFIIWLFHASSIIGIALGYFDWFVHKTPLNLVILSMLVMLNFPLDTGRKIMVGALFFIIGMFVEWMGVRFGFIFGEYMYGNNLGVKIDGVPILIGLNWAILSLSTAAIATKLLRQTWARVLVGAGMMVFLDFFIEDVTMLLDYWIWEEGVAPLRNYLSWFLLAALFQYIYQKLSITGDAIFSAHVYFAQLSFFVFLFMFSRFL